MGLQPCLSTSPRIAPILPLPRPRFPAAVELIYLVLERVFVPCGTSSQH